MIERPHLLAKQNLASFFIVFAAISALTSSLFSLTEETAEKLAFFGIPKIEKFYPIETKITGSIRSIANLPSGEIAVLTTTEINIFDGTRWTAFSGVPMPYGSFLVDDDSTLISNVNGLSRVTKNETGTYESQLLTLPEKQGQIVNSISHIAKVGDRTYFLHGRHLTEVGPSGNSEQHVLSNWASTLFAINDTLYITGGSSNLINRWDPESQSLIDNSFVMDDSVYEWVEISATRSEGGVWLATESQNIIGFDGEKSWLWPGNETLAKLDAKIRSLTETHDGGLAIGTASQGIFIFDSSAALVQHIDASHGLDSSTVNTIASDDEGGIWLANEHSLSRIDLVSNYVVFDERHGIPEGVLATAVFNDRLYVTTRSGVYSSNADATQKEDLFQLVLEQDSSTDLLAHDGLLFVGGPKLSVIRPDNTHFVLSETGANSFCFPKSNPNVMLVSTSIGLMRFNKQGDEWIQEPEVLFPDKGFYHFAETAEGDIFTSRGYPEVARIQITDTDTKTEIIPIEGSLNGNWCLVVEIQGRAYINSNPALRWDPESETFVEDREMEYYVGIPPYGFDHVFGKDPLNAYAPLSVHSGRMTPRPDFSVLTQVSNIGNDIETRGSTLLTDSSGNYWIGGYFGLMHIQPVPTLTVDQFNQPSIHRITSLTSGEPLPILQNAGESLNFEPDQKSLRIEVSFPQFNDADRNLYQIYVEGLDADWPIFSEVPFREITNLRPGDYTIRVNAATPASTAYGIEIPTYNLSFKLKAPWYQRKWAHALYTVLGIALVGGIVRFSDRRHEKRARLLQHLVDERTQEIATKNAVLEKQAQTLAQQNEELADKTDELTTTTEALTETLHQLQDTQEQLVDTARKAGKAEIAINVLHNVGNVLNSINVSLTTVSDKVANSKAKKLERLVSLLETHRQDIDNFLTKTPKGKAVPEFLTQLSRALNDEISTVSHELGIMEEDIAHVKTIIAAQQSHATSKSMFETVNVAELCKTALSITGKESTECGIEFVMEIDSELEIVTNKHQVLDILLNLLANAIESINEEKPAIGVITFTSVQSEDGKFVEICVTDNGVGIDEETQIKLFRHGFTTKDNGHGFGLHSCSNGAKTLGGDLDISSPGLHQGATAVLKLPTQTPRRLTQATVSAS